MTNPPQLAETDPRTTKVVADTLDLVAQRGIRGATMRDIATASGVAAATISSVHGSKDGLLAQSFAMLVDEEIAYFDERIAAAVRESLPLSLIPGWLWTLVEDAWGSRRAAMMALQELLLAAPDHPQWAASCTRWLGARHDAIRRLASALGCDPLPLEILSLHLLSESSFAISCGISPAYRLVAGGGFAEAAAVLLEMPRPSGQAALTDLSTRFHAEPAAQSTGADGRATESRERIIDAAATLIMQSGLASVTNRSVAQLAGVSPALTTYHFNAIGDLAFAGISRVFQKATIESLQPDPSSTVSEVLARSDSAGGFDRIWSRGMVEISLAAARGVISSDLGLGIRRQRGALTHAALRRSHATGVTRMQAASYALWASAARLVAASAALINPPLDFTAHDRRLSQKLLSQS